jgi:hypothetical protein
MYVRIILILVNNVNIFIFKVRIINKQKKNFKKVNHLKLNN